MIEKSIIESFAEGDERSFHTIYVETFPKVITFAMGLLKNRDDAEDVAQTIFINMWIKRKSFYNINNIDAYLFACTKNAVLNYISSSNRMMEDIGILRMETDDASPYEDVVEKDTKLLVEMIVSQMPRQRQNIYRMSREEGLCNEEIASKLNISKKTVENHLNLALNDIRKSLIGIFFIVNLLGAKVFLNV